MRELLVHELGLIELVAARERQLELVAAVQGGAPDQLLLCEHPPVITLGRAQKALANVLDAGDVPVVELERGGDATYHAPGQLVAYPIVQLEEGERDLHRYLRHLEQAVIDVAQALGVRAGRREGATGVWVDGARKLASIGIACRRWVCFHGVAINVTTDLDGFFRLRPCGFDPGVMTSMARELGDDSVTIGDFGPRLSAAIASRLGRKIRASAPDARV
jgi:lipoyl(octanoyl) transferase